MIRAITYAMFAVCLFTNIGSSHAMDKQSASFMQMFENYKDLNTRLENIAHKIKSANKDMCPSTHADMGLSVHTVADYPLDFQNVARNLLPVSEQVSIRTIRKNSPAYLSGLREGDEIIQLDQTNIISGVQGKAMFETLSKEQTKLHGAHLFIRRNGKVFQTRVQPENVCDYPVHVYFSDTLNGHTDGKNVWITSELIKTTKEDVHLALVVAHEMAHAIAGHIHTEPTKALELEADSLAIVMLAKAGYDIDQAVKYWDKAPNPQNDIHEVTDTHPTLAERKANLKQAATYVKKGYGMAAVFPHGGA